MTGREHMETRRDQIMPRSAMQNCASSTAIVTGAASGIGREISSLLGARGYRLVLVDIDAAGLVAQARDLRGAYGCGVEMQVVDLAQPQEVSDLCRDLQSTYGQDLTLLVNNAGIALGGGFDAVGKADFDACMQINFGTPVQLVRALIPQLEAGEGGWIVNVSSVFGIIAPPRQTAYSASKFALRGFSEALTHELASRPGIGVTTAYPGGVKTAIARNARAPDDVAGEVREQQVQAMERKLTMEPLKAAELILDAVDRRAPRVVIGRDAKLAQAIQRLLPGSYWNVVGRRE